ncbi:cytotoxic and regulatory T-cell molecule isoform X2 [Oryzias latipes]|uniref:cytotoxic and regulatory T-cell molecule isoform X2 n=1 Tax=Oryzias latipes TaxID=8090 RepID=UPI0005CC43EF|nr:cytotoxic and regulatory T-cell molecule isoform X2 [Oryzias latipes]
MEVILHLSVFLLLVKVSAAALDHVTVVEGHTVTLNCNMNSPLKRHVEWKNPDGYVIFFNHIQALKDKRYSINRLSESEFSISISNVNFKDGGTYTCAYYNPNTTEMKVELTVLGLPRMTRIKHKGTTLVKCSAKANHHPPQILWSFDSGPEFRVYEQVRQRDKMYESIAFLQMLPVMRRIKVKCRSQHPAGHSQLLMDFVKIRQNTKTTIPIGPSKPPFMRTTAAQDKNKMSSVPKDLLHQRVSHWTVASRNLLSRLPPSPGTSVVPPLSSTTLLPESSTISNNDLSEATNLTAISAVSEDIIPSNSTDRNTTGSFMKKERQRNSILLVLLVTCLIFGLSVVVVFFALKLRRAHFAWRRVFVVTENEDSNPSEESSKSKSTQEDKNLQGQRQKGHLITAFTQYVAEKPTNTTSVPSTSAITSQKTTEKDPSQSQTVMAPKGIVKETCL